MLDGMKEFHSKLPHTVPKSLQLKPHDPGPLVKARTHDRKAERLRQDDDAKANLEYLERWRALEHAVTTVEKKAQHEFAGLLGVDEVRPHEVVGHLIASLPRPRMDAIFRDPRIADLNVALGHRDLRNLIDHNELLQDIGIDWKTFLDAKRDLKFQLGIQTYRSAQAIAVYLTVIRAAADPKVKKRIALVRDEEVLALASGILRDVTTHVIDQMQEKHDVFFTVGDRKQVGEEFRIDRAKRSHRELPVRVGEKEPPKTGFKAGTVKPLPQKPTEKPRPGARKV